MTLNAIYRCGVVYTNTTLQVPLDLKERAKKRGINLTQTFVKALEKEVKKGNARGQNVSSTKTPASLSSTRDEVDK